MSVPGVLAGVRVIDVSTGPAAGTATMVLADFGADVVKVEAPAGDRFRVLPSSPLWLRGKRSVVLDLATDEGRGALEPLLAGADVLVVGGPPSRARGWRLDDAAIAVRHPHLIHCALTGWGMEGALAEHPGYVQTVAAKAGRMMSFAGQLRRPGPTYAAIPVAVHAAAHGAVQGIVSALIARDRGRRAGPVRSSVLQGLFPHDLVELLWVELESRHGVNIRPGTSDMPTLNYHPVLTSDGVWLQCGNLLEHLFLSFLEAIGLLEELLVDDRFAQPPGAWSPDATEHARDRMLERMREHTAEHWMAVFAANGNVAAEPFRTPDAALDHPDLRTNGSVVTVEDPVLGPVEMIGPIARLSTTPAWTARTAPTVGQHTDEVLSERRTATARSVSMRPIAESASAAPVADRGPLDGITIVELASVIAAPLGVSMLADLGARVLRIEPTEGDSFRQHFPYGVMTAKTTAGKRSICVDLKHPDGRDIARQLIARADVLVHNYRPGVPERLGVGFDELHAAHPGLVWVCVNGYGPDGPSARRPATHPVAGAAMGGAGYQAAAALEVTGGSLADIREAARQIMRANDSSPDPNTAVIVASATLMALYSRDRTGQGQAVYVDMLTANAHANNDAFLRYGGMAGRPPLDDALFGTGPRNRLYPAAEGWVMLTVTTDAEWQRLCTVTGVHDEHEFGAWVAERSADDVEGMLTGVRVACVRADEMTVGAFASRHGHVTANGFAPEVDHARFGHVRRWGPLVTVGDSGCHAGPGVLAGQHTDEVLAELGRTAAQIADLRAARIVASEPVDRLVP